MNTWYNIFYKGEINDQMSVIKAMKELIDNLVKVEGSRESVANKLGISPSMLSMLYTGSRNPTDDVLTKIKDVYPGFKNMVMAIHINRIK